VELETHKALVEVRAGRPAVLRRIICAAGDWQAVGKPLALLSDEPDENITNSADGLSVLPVNFEIS
jgi:pyruvate/2-oxoglutarate dehydrogenase complex dihydrolipoamide acyltransferase (E2) component